MRHTLLLEGALCLLVLSQVSCGTSINLPQAITTSRSLPVSPPPDSQLENAGGQNPTEPSQAPDPKWVAQLLQLLKEGNVSTDGKVQATVDLEINLDGTEPDFQFNKPVLQTNPQQVEEKTTQELLNQVQFRGDRMLVQSAVTLCGDATTPALCH